jgi:hypothetical protein
LTKVRLLEDTGLSDSDSVTSRSKFFVDAKVGSSITIGLSWVGGKEIYEVHTTVPEGREIDLTTLQGTNGGSLPEDGKDPIRVSVSYRGGDSIGSFTMTYDRVAPSAFVSGDWAFDSGGGTAGVQVNDEQNYPITLGLSGDKAEGAIKESKAKVHLVRVMGDTEKSYKIVASVEYTKSNRSLTRFIPEADKTASETAAQNGESLDQYYDYYDVKFSTVSGVNSEDATKGVTYVLRVEDLAGNVSENSDEKTTPAPPPAPSTLDGGGSGGVVGGGSYVWVLPFDERVEVSRSGDKVEISGSLSQPGRVYWLRSEGGYEGIEAVVREGLFVEVYLGSNGASDFVFEVEDEGVGVWLVGDVGGDRGLIAVDF